MLEIASDVATAAATFAGLILVFLGATVTGYEGFDATQQPAVRSRYLQRAWFAAATLFVSLVSCGLGLVGKAAQSWGCSAWGFGTLCLAVFLIVILAGLAAMDIE
jgi:hypothetical protein